ncbi:MAG: FAD-dependent oxidoreductase [Rhodovibrionaceae bacterium]
MPADFIDSYYSRSLSAAEAAPYPALRGVVEAEVCVVGGGMAGLATALGLAERGVSVVLLESQRLGWGASGRNGGFVSPGYATSSERLIGQVGEAGACELYRLTQDAYDLIRARIARYEIGCGPVEGLIRLSWFGAEKAFKEEAAFMAEHTGEVFEYWPEDKVAAHYASPRYRDGLFQPKAMHLNSLKLCLGTARAAVGQGARIFEDSAVICLEKRGEGRRVVTAAGRVDCDQVVLCGSAYLGGLDKRVERATLPVYTFVMLTEPLGKRLASAIRAPYGVHDDRFALDYYRPLPDTRLLWGGRISMLPPPRDLKAAMLGDLLKVYPQLAGVEAEVAWSGTMAYATHKMPQIGEIEPGLWVCSAFGGHGMCATTAGGEIIAKAIAEGDETYRLFAPFGLDYAGGILRPALVQGAYWYYELRDWLKSPRSKSS